MGLSIAQKNELLFQDGINFNTLPNWQKRGVGVYWETFSHAGFNPIKNETATTTRQRLKHDFDLPMREDYSAFIRYFLHTNTDTSMSSKPDAHE